VRGARDGDVAPDVRDGVVQAEGRGVDAGVARPAAGGVPRAGRRRLDQAPARGPPGPPVLRRPARAEQEMVIDWLGGELEIDQLTVQSHHGLMDSLFVQ